MLVLADAVGRDIPANGIGVEPNGCCFKARHHAVHCLEDVARVVLERPINVTARAILRASVAEVLVGEVEAVDDLLRRDEITDLRIAEDERQCLVLGLI